MSFHVEPETVRRYQANLTDRVASASIEAHLTVCESCRELLIPDAGRVGRTWAGVQEEIEPGDLGAVERTLLALRVPGHIARLIAVSPNLRVSFILAVGVALAFAFAANTARSGAEGHIILFILVAPVIPVVGVALAYGRVVDPVFELTLSTPVNSLRLILIRTVAVLGVSAVMSLAVWTLAPVPETVGATAWLLPALSLTIATIALASRIEIASAALGVSVTWAATVALSQARNISLHSETWNIFHFVVLLAAVAVLVARRNSYEREGGRR